MADSIFDGIGTGQPSGPATDAAQQPASSSLFAGIGDDPAATEGKRGTIAANLRAGGQGMLAIGAGLATGVQQVLETPLRLLEGPSAEGALSGKSRLLEQYKNDPEGFHKAWQEPRYALQRFSEAKQAEASSAMDPANLTPEAVERQKLQYLTPDPAKSVFSSPTRLAGDILSSPSTVLPMVASAGTALLTRNPMAAGAVGGTVGGGMEGVSQILDVREKLEESPLQAWEAVPRFKELRARGWHPDMARRFIIEQAATDAGLRSGLAASVLDAIGGRLIGHAGGTRLGSAVRAGTGELVTEGAQSAEQFVGARQAQQRTVDPNIDIFEGIGEATTQGAFTGGVVGAGAGAAGHHRPPAAPAPVAPPPAPSGSVDNNVGNIIAGKNPDGSLRFQGFNSPEEGVAATVRLAMAYPGRFNQGQPMSVRQIAEWWLGGPAGYGATGDNPNTWAKVVADSMGIGVNDILDLSNSAQAEAFAKGVHRIEKGAKALLPDDVYKQGASLALSGVPIPSFAPPADLALVRKQQTLGLTDADLDATADHPIDEELAKQGRREVEGAQAPGDVLETIEATRPTGTVAQQRYEEGVPWQSPSMAVPAAKPTTQATNVGTPSGPQQGQIDGTALAQRVEDLEVAAQRARQPKSITDLWRTTPVTPPAIEPDRPAYGRTEEAQGTLAGTPNPNNSMALLNLPVAHGPYKSQIGKPLRQANLRPGDVVGAGVPTEHYPAEYFRDLVATVKELIDLFAPNARVIVTAITKGLRTDQSWMRRVSPKAGFYVINPRNATRITEHKSYNNTTRAQIMYGLVHEVGHVMVEEHFLAGLPEAQQNQLKAIGQTDPFELIPANLIAQLPADRAAIAQEFNDRKSALLDNPKATLRDWLREMASPQVFVQGLGQNKKVTIAQWAKEYFGQHAMDRPLKPALLAYHAEWPAGALHEYLADQLARYAQNKGLLRNTTLGKSQWFADLWGMLQDAFRAFTRAKLLPKELTTGKAFEDFVTGLAAKPGRNRGGAYQQVPDVGRMGEQRFAVPDTILQYLQTNATSVTPRSFLESTTAADQQTAAIISPDGRLWQFNQAWMEALNGAPYHPQFNEDNLGSEHLFANVRAYHGGGENALGIDPPIGGLTDRQVATVRALQGTFERAGLGRGYVSPTVEPDTSTNTLPEAYGTEAASVGIQVRDQPGVPEAARGEALEQLARGQIEQAKDTVEEGLDSGEVIHWAGPLPPGLQTHIDQLAKAKVPGWRGLGQLYRRLGEHLDWMVGMREYAFSDPNNRGAQFINSILTLSKEFQGTLERRATDNVIDPLSKLGRKQAKAVWAFLEKEWNSGQHLTQLRQSPQGEWTHTPTPQWVADATAAGLTQRGMALALAVKNEHLFRQQQGHRTIAALLVQQRDAAQAAGRPASVAYYQKQLRDLAIGMRQIREAPFLPMTRFGQYLLEVRHPTLGTVHVETYDSVLQRARARERLAASSQTRGLTYREDTTDGTSAVLRVLPLEHLGQSIQSFGLTKAQVASLRKTLDFVTTNPKLRKYSLALGSISGHSRDYLRTFADFMHHDALVLNKLTYGPDFRAGLAMVDADIDAANNAGDSNRIATLERSKSYLDKAVGQILNPAHEYHLLRSFVVLKQLGFGIKTAMVNITSLGNTLAVITTRLGSVRGTATLLKAMSDAGQSIIRGSQILKPEEAQAIEQAKTHGTLVETYAADMASMATGSWVDKYSLPQTYELQHAAARGWAKTLRASMWLQRQVEEYARRTTFLAMFRAFRQQGLPAFAPQGAPGTGAALTPNAYEAAKQAVEITQGDNSIQTRAPIVRGWKSLFLIYFNFMRNMLWQFGGAPARGYRAREAQPQFLPGGAPNPEWLPKSKGWANETVRLWLVWGFLGGLMGLPGADDADKLVEAVSEKLFGRRFSIKEHAYEFAAWLSDNLASVGLDISPRSIVHGGLQDIDLGFGRVDLSTSAGMGHFVPGLGGADRLGEDGSKFLLDLLGPFGREFQNGLDAFNGQLPLERRLALFIPNAVQSLIKATDPEPRFFNGARISIDPSTGDIRSLTTGELLNQLMGFQPSIVSINREVDRMQKDMRAYWIERRNGLLKGLFETRQSGEQDAYHDVMSRIREYNDVAPRAMALTADSIRQSLVTRSRTVQRQEAGLPQQPGLALEWGAIRETVMGRPRQ